MYVITTNGLYIISFNISAGSIRYSNDLEGCRVFGSKKQMLKLLIELNFPGNCGVERVRGYFPVDGVLEMARFKYVRV